MLTIPAGFKAFMYHSRLRTNRDHVCEITQIVEKIPRSIVFRTCVEVVGFG